MVRGKTPVPVDPFRDHGDPQRDAQIRDRLKRDEERRLRVWPGDLLETWYGTEVWQVLRRGDPVVIMTAFGDFTVLLPVEKRGPP